MVRFRVAVPPADPTGLGEHEFHHVRIGSGPTVSHCSLFQPGPYCLPNDRDGEWTVFEVLYYVSARPCPGGLAA
jgi:hypothetical protein